MGLLTEFACAVSFAEALELRPRVVSLGDLSGHQRRDVLRREPQTGNLRSSLKEREDSIGSVDMGFRRTTS